MSHFTTIKTQLKDIKALKQACSELGLSVLQNTEARGYGRNHQHGAYVIRLKGPFDIAANKQEDDTFGLTTDWWGGHVQQEVGKDYGKLLQLYGVYKATAEARKKGYTVSRQAVKDGSIKLTIGGM